MEWTHVSQRASGLTTQTSYGEMSGELSRHRQRVEVFRGPQNLEDNVVSSSDGLKGLCTNSPGLAEAEQRPTQGMHTHSYYPEGVA